VDHVVAGLGMPRRKDEEEVLGHQTPSADATRPRPRYQPVAVDEGHVELTGKKQRDELLWFALVQDDIDAVVRALERRKCGGKELLARGGKLPTLMRPITPPRSKLMSSSSVRSDPSAALEFSTMNSAAGVARILRASRSNSATLSWRSRVEICWETADGVYPN